jgi:hypothetical protein
MHRPPEQESTSKAIAEAVFNIYTDKDCMKYFKNHDFSMLLILDLLFMD